MYNFELPDLGEGIHEAEILRWYVAVGERIEEDAPLVDVETDKAAVTLPSPRAGTERSQSWLGPRLQADRGISHS